MRYQDQYQDKKIRIESSLDAEYRMTMRFEGTGTSGGTRAFIRMLTEMHALTPDSIKISSLLDCHRYGRTQLRAQLTIGKWLLKNKAKTDKIAVVGAQPYEEKVGRAIMRIARIQSISFFKTVPEAHRWLGWT